MTRPSTRTAAGATRTRIPRTDLAIRDTHRLIASRFSASGTVLSRLSAAQGTVTQLMELDDATNDRFLGEEGLLPGIGIRELVYGVRYAHIVNAAFSHASPAGGRFNTPTRGAWYCAFDRATALAEIAFHKLLHLEEISWPEEEVSTSDTYLADLTSSFHDLRTRVSSPMAGFQRSPAATSQPFALVATPTSSISPLPSQAPSPFTRYLRSGPIPRCYHRSQQLAERLLGRRSNGIIYPSVRQPSGTCIAVFRPALVYNVRRAARLELRLQAGRPFRPSQAREVPIPPT